jgi:hypothetical protein
VLANLRPRGVGETLDAAVSLYRSRFGALVRITALVVIPVQMLNVLVTLSTAPSGSTVGPTGVTGVYDSRTSFWTPLAGNLTGTIITALSTAFATAAVVRLVADTYLSGGITQSDSTRLALHRVGAVLWLAILSGVVVSLATFACFIPGIWLQVAWAVAMPALLLENKSVGAAIGRSFQLTKNNWWRCAGIYWVGQILSLFVTLVLAGVIAFAIRSYAHGTAALAIEQGISRSIAVTLVTPFLAAAIIVMYFDLRIRSEGFDVQMALRDLDHTRDAVAPAQAG